MALSFTLEGFMAGLCETATHLGQLFLAKNESNTYLEKGKFLVNTFQIQNLG